jgi:peptidoglycan/xylan/chitin deacetylase (PgdA/CDA1 family)
MLSQISINSQRNEILGSKVRLEELIGRPVNSFSYPYGDLSAKTADISREAEFACGCTVFPNLVEQVTDPFQLPRVMVPDWEGEKFGRWLSRWLG